MRLRRPSPIEKEILLFGLLFGGMVAASWIMTNIGKAVRHLKKVIN